MKKKLNFRQLKSINGWLSNHDFTVINSLLEVQSSKKSSGDILEIGAYHGKCSVVLGQWLHGEERLLLCDIFENASEIENEIENINSYQQLNSKFLISNLRRFGIESYDLLNVNSNTLRAVDFANPIRFIHIDGSHLYPYVVSDLALAAEILSKDFGIISVDDFRSQHTIGVSAAVWEAILVNRKLKPILITPCKIYLCHFDSYINLDLISELLNNKGIEVERIVIKNFNLLRTLHLYDGEVYRNGPQKSDFIPPIAVRITRYLQKRLRTRRISSRNP